MLLYFVAQIGTGAQSSFRMEPMGPTSFVHRRVALNTGNVRCLLVRRVGHLTRASLCDDAQHNSCEIFVICPTLFRLLASAGDVLTWSFSFGNDTVQTDSDEFTFTT